MKIKSKSKPIQLGGEETIVEVWTCHSCNYPFFFWEQYPRKTDNGFTLLCNKCWERAYRVIEKNYEPAD